MKNKNLDFFKRAVIFIAEANARLNIVNNSPRCIKANIVLFLFNAGAKCCFDGLALTQTRWKNIISKGMFNMERRLESAAEELEEDC